jgi:hypothetical protein
VSKVVGFYRDESSGFTLRGMNEIILFRLFHGQADAENFYSSSALAGGQLKQ